MLKYFGKGCFTAILALLSLNASGLTADECCPSSCNRLYVGAFGGGLYSNKSKFNQTGVAFFTEAEGGPLAVNARGHTKARSTGYGGVQIGYEWTQCPINIGCGDTNLTPAVEVEGFWYKHSIKGNLSNDTDRLEAHDFVDSFSTRTGVYLINGLININNCCLGSFTPYIGGGIGAAHLSLGKARSIQVDPPEAGVNHFNNDRSFSDWAFAAQAKVGFRYNFCERFHLFVEYRYLFLGTTNYIFGSTNVPGHVPTTTWNVQLRRLHYNAFAVGLQYDL